MKPFQFEIRSLLVVMMTMALGMALSMKAPLGFQLGFLISFCGLWAGALCVAYVCDQREWSMPQVFMLLFGQTVVLFSLCICVTCLGFILKSLIGPWLSLT